MRKFVLYIAIVLCVGTAGVTLFPGVASAQTGRNPEACSRESSAFLGFPTWYKYLEPRIENGTCTLTFPKDTAGNTDLGRAAPPILLAVFEIILRVAGLVAVGYVIYGGFTYLISQGEPDRIKGARTTIVNALIGLAIAVSATAIVNLFVSKIV